MVRLHELQREADANRTLGESYLARYKDTAAQESLEMPDLVSSQVREFRFNRRLRRKAHSGLRSPARAGRRVARGFSDRLSRPAHQKTVEQAEAISGAPALAAIPLIGAREIARRAQRGRKEQRSTIRERRGCFLPYAA